MENSWCLKKKISGNEIFRGINLGLLKDKKENPSSKYLKCFVKTLMVIWLFEKKFTPMVFLECDNDDKTENLCVIMKNKGEQKVVMDMENNK